MDEEEVAHKVQYLDVPEGEEPLETNWIVRAGRAAVTYPDGSTYEGDFNSERLKHGQGTFVWVTAASEDDDTKQEKARYEGQYFEGKRQGVGKMTFPNGDTFHGNWLQGKMHGEGTYIFKASGDIYSGGFEDGLKHGEGIYEYDAGQSQLVGEWQQGKFTNGTWRFKETGEFIGSFKDGKPHGQGKFVLSNGITHTGQYVGGPNADAGEEAEEEPQPTTWQGDAVYSC